LYCDLYLANLYQTNLGVLIEIDAVGAELEVVDRPKKKTRNLLR
jgi:hypothetical protein